METYQDTLEWMFSKLPMYQRKGASAYRPGLEAMKQLDEYLEAPHKSFKSIHIAGTNGKGSTAHMMASVLQTAGFKTALYTSPHLLDFRERIKVDGKLIPKGQVVEFISKHKRYFERERLSFFEMTVALAFWYFKKQKVDYAVIEVGLGGRLDATNIITPVISVITNIGLDHTQFLGNTHAAIAAEKAGIIKTNVPVIIGENDLKTRTVFESTAQKASAPINFNSPSKTIYRSDLEGPYQKNNSATAVKALLALEEFKLDEKTIQKGLLNVVKNTKLMGRWQKIGEAPEIIVDVAHNKEGLQLISSQLKKMEYKNLHLVMGFVKGRAVDELLTLFPKNARYYLSSPNLERAIPLHELKTFLAGVSLKLDYFDTIPNAFKTALEEAYETDLVFVLGSTFVAAEVLAYKKSNISE